MSRDADKTNPSRREMFGALGRAVTTAAVAPLIQTRSSPAHGRRGSAAERSAGIDRVAVLPGKTYLRGWAGYGDPPRRAGPVGRRPRSRLRAAPAGPAVSTWSKESGPGEVTFADPKALITTATFTTPGAYVLKLTADNGQRERVHAQRLCGNASSGQAAGRRLHQELQDRQPVLERPRQGADRQLDSPLHRHHQPHRCDAGPGGIDNFVEAGKKLRGEPPGYHKGYVFSNAWVHQTVEAMSIALMIDPQGDPEIIKAHEKFRATLEDWIPKILAAQEPDGYLQTAFTLDRAGAPTAASSRAASSSIGTRATAAITKATPPATSWNRPSIIT